MPRTIRYHLDEHCASALAEGLRRHGIDVTTAADAGLLQASDEDHVDFALREGRVIFTQDDDYLALNARGVPRAGITDCHQQSRSIGEIVDSLVLIWEIYEPSEMVNRVEYLRPPRPSAALTPGGRCGRPDEWRPIPRMIHEGRTQ